MIKFQRRAFGRHWQRLARDTSGAILVEFAFVAGPLIALLIATLQVSLVFFAQQNLETTTEKATRQLLTGQAQGAGMTQSQFKTAVCSKLAAFMKCANVLVDVQKVADFDSANTSAPTITYDSNGNVTNGWTYTPGGAGQITVVRIMYVWDVSKGPLGFDLSTLSNGDRLLVATAVFKTEPFQ